MPISKLYVRRLSKAHAQDFKAGEVIFVAPADHQFGRRELLSREHAILTADIAEDVAFSLTAEAHLQGMDSQDTAATKRGVYLDLAALGYTPEARVRWRADSPTVLTQDQIVAAVRVKPPT